MKSFITCLALFLLNIGFAQEIVEFSIQKGTGQKPWNTKETAVYAQVGQILRITNNDTIVHRLHTLERPCTHGRTILPGKTYDCVLTAPFSSDEDGPLYDHNIGQKAEFWIYVIEEEQEVID